MACEKPVVAMECGGHKYVILNKEYGLTTKKFDTTDMADKIEFLLKNKDTATKIGKNGRNFISKNISIEKTAMKLYHSIID